MTEVHYDIRLEDICWTYSGTTSPAIKNINLKVKKGEIIVITGPSGAGKTTVCSCFNGLIPHFHRGEMTGNIFVKKMNVKKHDTAIMAGFVGFVFDSPANQLFCTTVREEIAFGPENYCLPVEEILKRVEDAINFSRLNGYEERNPHSLSGGEQQACAIAAIAAMHPSIFVLDEPTSNLDPEGTEIVFDRINELVRSEEKTLIIVEHKLAEVLPYADRLIVMDRGEITINDTPHNTLKRTDEIIELGLQVPHVTVLANELKKRGYEIDEMPITLEEGVKLFSQLFDNKRLRIKGPESIKSQESAKQNQVIISCKEVWYTYPDGTDAVCGVDIDIYNGEFIGIIGKNGSGKTTLAKTFNGLYKPTSGKVLLSFGGNTYDSSEEDVGFLSRYIGYCFQNPDDQIFLRKVRDEVGYGLKNMKLLQEEQEKRINDAIEVTELTPFADRPPYSLSQGLRQRLAVASILAMEPKVLIIDEPTTGQDWIQSKAMLDLAKKLNQRGETIIVITHNMPLIAQYASRLIVMLDGKILVEGTPKEVFSQPELIEKASIKPPQVTRLGQALSERYNVPRDILNVEEFLNILEFRGMD